MSPKSTHPTLRSTFFWFPILNLSLPFPNPDPHRPRPRIRWPFQFLSTLHGHRTLGRLGLQEFRHLSRPPPQRLRKKFQRLKKSNGGPTVEVFQPSEKYWQVLFCVKKHYIYISIYDIIVHDILFIWWEKEMWKIMEKHAAILADSWVVALDNVVCQECHLHHPPVITIFIGAMVTIASHGWFIIVKQPHDVSLRHFTC